MAACLFSCFYNLLMACFRATKLNIVFNGKYSIFLSYIQGQECKCFSAYKHRKVPYEKGKRKFIYTGIDSDLFFFV